MSCLSSCSRKSPLRVENDGRPIGAARKCLHNDDASEPLRVFERNQAQFPNFLKETKDIFHPLSPLACRNLPRLLSLHANRHLVSDSCISRFVFSWFGSSSFSQTPRGLSAYLRRIHTFTSVVSGKACNIPLEALNHNFLCQGTFGKRIARSQTWGFTRALHLADLRRTDHSDLRTPMSQRSKDVPLHHPLAKAACQSYVEC